MPTWLSITLQIVMPVLAVVATAIISLEIRFGSSKGAVKRELKSFALRVARWICNLGTIGFLVYHVFFVSGPVTRVVVCVIAFQVAAIMFVVAMYIIKLVVNSFDSQIKLVVDSLGSQVGKLADSIIKTNEVINLVSESISLQDQLLEDRLRSLLLNSDKVP